VGVVPARELSDLPTKIRIAMNEAWSVDDSEPEQFSEVPWIEATTIGPEAARDTWALAARHALENTARDYHAVITAAELGEFVQQRSRIRTKQAYRYWIGDVLYRVAHDCVRRREPVLGALCVNANGTMGDWYADTLLHLRDEQIDDREQHAAEERLECYRYHGADLPPGGGEPALPPRPEPPARAARAPRATGSTRPPRAPRAAKPAPAPKKVEAAPKVCPTCFMALPASGQCDFCD